MKLKVGHLVKKTPKHLDPRERVRLGVVLEVATVLGETECYVQWDAHRPEGPMGASWHAVSMLKRVPPLVGLAMQASTDEAVE